ncbi:MAG: Metallo-dependent phosphatase-like protein [Monoraphidium minutum]|nr:MAG: Metallo-dependent phosphatase-like protein [Monoraphidium minutum]
MGTMRSVLLLLLGALLCRAARPGPSSQLREAQEDCTPRQVHIALAGDAASMHVSWKTAGTTCRSEVSWWCDRGVGADASATNAGGMLRSAVGYSFLLSERDMCAEPAAANDFELYLHRAVMTNLELGARYRYRVAGGDASWGFQAAPATRPGHAFKFVAFGDMGESEHAAAKSPGAAPTLERLLREDLPSGLDLALHVGDVSYADGVPEIWDAFMDSIEPLAARVPYMVQVGNHEYGYDSGADVDPSGGRPYAPAWGNFGPDSGGECGVMLARRFEMPSRGRADNPPFWYAFDYGSVHFVAVSTEHDLEPGSRQYEWLAAELAAVDRCRTPWLVLLMHRPIYVVYPHKSNRQVGEHIRAALEPLLRRHLVDLAISGHVHSYYRTCPVFDESCTDGDDETSAGGRIRRGGGGGGGGHGTVHLVVGSAGHKLSALEEGQEEWVAAAERVWGYTRFSVESGSRMAVEFVESETGRVLDAFELAASAERLRGACPAAADSR